MDRRRTTLTFWERLAQREVMLFTLGVSVVGYICMFVILKTEYDIYNSDFFYTSVDPHNTTNNPVVLGVRIQTKGQQAGLCVFFILNSFLGVLNSVLVDGLFGMMIYEEGEGIIRRLTQMYGGPVAMLVLFSVYDMWRSARVFFSILGMYSNIVFFTATTAGTLAGGLFTKLIFLSHYGFLKVQLDCPADPPRVDIDAVTNTLLPSAKNVKLGSNRLFMRTSARD